jgi:hypothetical protein
MEAAFSSRNLLETLLGLLPKPGFGHKKLQVNFSRLNRSNAGVRGAPRRLIFFSITDKD